MNATIGRANKPARNAMLREVNAVCLLSGKPGVGKTSLVSKLLNGEIPTQHDPTIQDVMTWETKLQDAIVELEITDTSGSQEYADMREKWVREANGMILVYSVDDLESFAQLRHTTQLIQKIKGYMPPMVLVGNKMDMHNRQVSEGQGEAFATSLGCPFMETSLLGQSTAAKEVFYTIINELRTKPSRGSHESGPKEKACCCVQ
eukprot:m.76045 g.76045  ORF g.76045 m.76045 type:complete len:204 (-) comp14621_c1_seq2:945-1556(-)